MLFFVWYKIIDGYLNLALLKYHPYKKMKKIRFAID